MITRHNGVSTCALPVITPLPQTSLPPHNRSDEFSLCTTIIMNNGWHNAELNQICVAFSLALHHSPVSGGGNATQDDADCLANGPERLSGHANKLFGAKVNLHKLRRRTTRHAQHDAKGWLNVSFMRHVRRFATWRLEGGLSDLMHNMIPDGPALVSERIQGIFYR